MHFRLVRPVKRKGSINQYFVQRIPADVKSCVAGLRLDIPLGARTFAVTLPANPIFVRLSLRARDPSEVKMRHAQVVAYLEGVWGSVRTNQPLPLSHRNAVALAKRAYAAWAVVREQTVTVTLDMETRRPIGQHLVNPENLDPEVWGRTRDQLQAVLDADDEAALEANFGPGLDAALLKVGHGALAPSDRMTALRAFGEAHVDGLSLRGRQAAGDYSPDPRANRFPDFVNPTKPAVPATSLTGLVEAWWVESKAAGLTLSTYESYRSTFARLTAFVGHDDATAVTPQDIVRFKNHRLGQGVSPKTVGDSDISGLRSVMGWAVGNRLLSANPADGIKVKRPKAVTVRDKGLTPKEASAILSHSLHHRRGQESPKTFAAKRWVPWLCAYTGARVGEMVQLRKEDLRHADGVWIVTITPEAGTVKDKEARSVVLHDHLVEAGFPAFVKATPAGYLFVTPSKTGDVRGVWRSCKNRVREFVREVVTDPNVAPNHGWRHAFKTVGREAGIEDSVLDAICGHAAKTVGGSYGGVSIKTQQKAMKRFPRYAVD